MLLELRVTNLGIIEEINWSLGYGLNVITGETGAGKSLVIDAVEALLAGKVDEDAIRYEVDKAQIEGIFVLPQDKHFSQLRELLATKGLESNEETMVINCEFRREGRGIVRVNGHAVPRGLLHQIGHLLVDLHGQSEHLSLLDKKYHLDFLDSYAHTIEQRYSFSTKALELYKGEQELKALVEEEKGLARREEFLRFQIDEIKRAKLREGEEEALKREENIVSSIEKLRELSCGAYHALYGEDTSVPSTSALDKVNEAIGMMIKIVDFDPALKQQIDSLQEALYRLEEVSQDIRSYSDRLEYDPQRLEEIESRFELIRNLERKYGHTVTEVLDYLKNAERELDELSDSAQRQSELEGICSDLKKEMGQIASEISKARSKSAKKLVTEVKRELQDLNMSQVEFEVAITRIKDRAGIPFPDGETYAFNNEGVDSVEFTVSTNPGEPLKPLSNIASTGEISRFMLALKSSLSQADNIPVLIFDEIDIGVGGRSGEIIGKKLWTLAQNRQVICVTHLPQIAAFADAHFSIRKEVSGARTLSTLKTLEGASRMKEIATMLSGSQYTEASMNNAHELVQKAARWKEAHCK
ncbi:DNA repair protein RecN [Chloroflexota bacterium]